MVRAWHVQNGKLLAAFKAHAQGTINCLAFTPDGSRLATGAWDGVAHLWDLPNGRERAVYKGHRNGVTVIAGSPYGGAASASPGDRAAPPRPR